MTFPYVVEAKTCVCGGVRARVAWADGSFSDEHSGRLTYMMPERARTMLRETFARVRAQGE